MKPETSIRFMNKSQLACLLNKSLFTIDAWIRKGMPFVKKGSQTKEWEFDVSDVCKWREDHAIATALGNIEDLGIEELKKKKLAVEVNILEIDLQERKGEIVALKDVEQSLSHAYITIKQRLRTIPDRIVADLASQTDEHVCRELLVNEIDDALLELSQIDFDASQAE